MVLRGRGGAGQDGSQGLEDRSIRRSCRISNTVTITVEDAASSSPDDSRWTSPLHINLKTSIANRGARDDELLGLQDKRRQETRTRWLEEETRCPMAWRLASGPQRTPGTDMVQNFSPKAYHPAVQARVAQLDRAHPVRRIHLAAYHRAKACARHAIGANQDWLGRGFRGQPMPILLSHLDFPAPSPLPLHSNLTTRTF